MKVLMLSWEFPPHNVGGLGKHVMELVPALARAGVEVHLITPGWNGDSGQEVVQETAVDPAHPEPPPTIVHRIEPPAVDRADFFSSAWRTNLALEEYGRSLIAQGGYDLIHAHDWLVAFAGIALKHAYRLPLLATIHATEYGRNRGFPTGAVGRQIHNVEWELSFEAWRIICCSAFMAREIATVFGAPLNKLDVVPNGVDTSRFDALAGADLTGFRRRYALDSEKIVFYVGRVVHEKGVHLLVEAMPRLLAQRPDAKLVVAGTGGSLGHCQYLAGQLGLGDKVLFAGFIADEDRDRLLRVADVGVFPSLYEPFGIVALEAMAAHLPVVVADVGGLSEVVTHEHTGVTVYPDDLGSLVWGIRRVLDDPVAAAARVAEAYRMVRERFNWDAIARSTLDVYQQVVRERAAAAW